MDGSRDEVWSAERESPEPGVALRQRSRRSSFLELRALEKTYADGTRAVRGVDLEVDEGEFLVLLGPSGCGKTTTLRMVAGLELASGGRILLRGEEVTHRRPAERDVGFVFQFYALYPHLSVRENIAFPLRCERRPRAEVEAAVGEVARRLGLEPLLDRRPRQLSGGDQQRVALARAMVRRPALFLMDEPLGTLDAARRMEMAEFLRARQLELGVTTLYVTHDQAEAMSLADRIVVMHQGRIEQVGPPAAIYDAPASLFVATFVGSPSMNLVEGSLERANGATLFRASGTGTELSLAHALEPQPAVLGLRPEAVQVREGAQYGARVAVLEHQGSHKCLHLDTPLGRLVARAPADHPARPGDELCFELDLERAHLFARAEGARL